MVIELWQVFLASVAGSGLFQLLYKIIEKVVDEWLADKKQKKSNKRELADQVIKICSEASSSKYSTPPRDREHIKYVAYKLESIDQKLSDDLLWYLREWQTYSQAQLEPVESVLVYKRIVKIQTSMKAKIRKWKV